jgi:uncharacterized protein (DUF302 family)
MSVWRTLLLSGLMAASLSVQAAGMHDVRTPLDYPEAMAMLQEAIARRGYTVARIQQVDKGLESGGFASKRQFRVVHFGRKDQLTLAMTRYPQLLAYLPLRIAIMEDAGGARLSALRPAIVGLNKTDMDDELAALLTEMDSDLERILKAASAY